MSLIPVIEDFYHFKKCQTNCFNILTPDSRLRLKHRLLLVGQEQSQRTDTHVEGSAVLENVGAVDELDVVSVEDDGPRHQHVEVENVRKVFQRRRQLAAAKSNMQQSLSKQKIA